MENSAPRGLWDRTCNPSRRWLFFFPSELGSYSHVNHIQQASTRWRLVAHFSRAGGPGHTLLGSLALRSCPWAGALAGVAIYPIHAASPILAGVANAFINILCTIRACPARITQAEISRDCCLQVRANAKKLSSKGINAVSRRTDIYTYFMWRYQSREIKHLECNYIDGDWWIPK